MRPRLLLAAALAGAAAGALVLAIAGGTSAAGTTCGTTGTLSGSTTLTCTYATVGSDTFTAPPGVTRVDVTVVGAAGGNYFIDGDVVNGTTQPAITGRSGGAGGEVAGTLAVTPGEVVQVDVAGRGGDGTAAKRFGGMQNGPSGGSGALGGFGGSDGGVAGGLGDAYGANGGSASSDGGNGSGGGGSSDLRMSAGGCASETCALSDRVLVAGGGGGGGGTGGQGNAIGAYGGVGGATNAGCPVTAAGPANNPGYGCGGFPDGGNPGASGWAGTLGTGGTPGLNPGRTATGANLADPRFGYDGTIGAQGTGGTGGDGNKPCTDPALGGACSPTATTSGGGAGGGGGGGFFGGGGGSGGGGTFGGGGGAGGGGGGGASYASSEVSAAAFTPDANCDPTTKAACSPSVNGGNGQVTVSWASTASGALALSVSAPGAAVAGQQSTATATLSGGSGPTGTITFRLYGPGDTSCQTPITTSTAAVAGGGTYSSTPATVAEPGTYRWVAAYGGDAANPATTVSCADAALVVVGAASRTTPNGPTPAGGTGGQGGAGGAVGAGGTRRSGAGKQRPGASGGSPLASVSRRGGTGPAAVTPPSVPPRAAGGNARGRPGGDSGRSRSPSAGADRVQHTLFGLLVDSPGTAIAPAGSNPLSALRAAGAGPVASSGWSPSAGWLAAAAVLGLLAAGVLREAELPRRRRREGLA